MARRFEKVLIDCSADIYEGSWQISSRNFPDWGGPQWSMTKFTLRGGKQHGVDVVELDNGEMTISVLPTRGMNVLHAVTDHARLAWDSPLREVIHPAYIEEGLRGGLGWLEGFNELMCRCGVESMGPPGPDVIIDNQGNKKTVMLSLHGRISNTPASRLWLGVDLEPPHRLTVGGDVYDTRMFGPSYMLRTAISTLPGASEFTIDDEIRNLGGQPAPMEILYHCNYGPPVLGEGARLVAPVRKVSARDHRALDGMCHWDLYGPPETGFVEQCYFFTLYADRQGRTCTALVNAEGDLAAAIRFSTRQLPCFTLWKNTASEADGYVTGLEPGSAYPNPRQFEREKGRLRILEPGEVYKASLSMALIRGRSEVKELRGRIAALAKGKTPQVCSEIDPDMALAG